MRRHCVLTSFVTLCMSINLSELVSLSINVNAGAYNIVLLGGLNEIVHISNALPGT